MFDNICSLPIPTDIFAQVVHPTEPIFSLGLASGHVYSNRLPAVGRVDAEQVDNSIGSSSDKSVRSKRNGFDKVDRIWETRRHKGSCRSLCYSTDGQSLISAGSDGLVKAADFETGRVQSKIAMPYEAETSSAGTPTVIHAISPHTLLLGTEESALHVYDLRKNNFSSYKPQQTYHPHDDYISSITPLPSSSSSDANTSNSKQFVTTGDTTLAVTDIRKGVLQRSEDQEEALLCSAFINSPSSSSSSSSGSKGKVLVGGAGGVLTLWQQGFWEDQDDRIVLDRSPGGGETLDVITKVPDAIGMLPGRKVAVGLGNGHIRFVRIGDNKPVGTVRHDEAEGVVAIGFDVAGRMISSGGSVVKIWHEKVENEDEDADEDEEEEEEEEEGEDLDGYEDQIDGVGVNGTTKRKAIDGNLGNSDDDSEEEEEEEQPSKRRRRKRQNKAARRNPGPGIMAFKGL